MTKKDGDKLRAMRKELKEMALDYGENSKEGTIMWELGSRIGLLLAGREREAADGLLSDFIDPLDPVVPS